MSFEVSNVAMPSRVKWSSRAPYVLFYFVFVVTVALYITFFVRHLLSNGHWFLSLQLQSDLSVSVFFLSNFSILC